MDYYKKEAANLIVAMGKDKAFEFAWWNIEANTPTDPMAAAYWTDVAECIDPTKCPRRCEMNKPTREEVLTLADTVALCGATRLAEVLRRSVKLEAENERLREALQDIARQPEGDEDSAQAVAKAALRQEV